MKELQDSGVSAICVFDGKERSAAKAREVSGDLVLIGARTIRVNAGCRASADARCAGLRLRGGLSSLTASNGSIDWGM